MAEEATHTEEEVVRFIEQIFTVALNKNKDQDVNLGNLLETFKAELQQYEDRIKKEINAKIPPNKDGRSAGDEVLAGVKADVQNSNLENVDFNEGIRKSMQDRVGNEGYRKLAFSEHNLEDNLEHKLREVALLNKAYETMKKLEGKQGDIILPQNSPKDEIPEKVNGFLKDSGLIKGVKEDKTRDWSVQSNEHWDNVNKYRHMQHQYLSSKADMEYARDRVNELNQKLNNLHKLGNSRHRFFTSKEELLKESKQLVQGIQFKDNNDPIRKKLENGEKLNKIDHIRLKLTLTELKQDFEQKFSKAEDRVEQIRKEAYDAYKTHSNPFNKVFSRDHHINDKLNRLITDEKKSAMADERKPAEERSTGREALSKGKEALSESITINMDGASSFNRSSDMIR
jgi:hypothetical protein